MRRAIALTGESAGSSRCLIYDPKNEFLSFVSQIATCPVYSLHPFLKTPRTRSWRMCLDIRNPKAAHQFAVTLIPKEEGNNNRYFSDGARAVVRGIVISFILNSP